MLFEFRHSRDVPEVPLHKAVDVLSGVMVWLIPWPVFDVVNTNPSEQVLY